MTRIRWTLCLLALASALAAFAPSVGATLNSIPPEECECELTEEPPQSDPNCPEIRPACLYN